VAEPWHYTTVVDFVDHWQSFIAGLLALLAAIITVSVMCIEDLDDLGKIGERAGQPVDLVDDDGVDPPRREVSQQLLQSGPINRGAREPAVIISRAEAHPTFVPLARDEGLTGFALRLQRIELLFEPLLGRFAGVNRTTDASVLPHCGSWLFHWLASATRMHALACRDQRTVAPTNVPR
jgi:hypothetical protein